MRTKVVGLVSAVVLTAGVGAWGVGAEKGPTFGFSGLVEVRELVVAYAPDTAGGTVTAHLVSGISVEYATKDADVLNHIIELSHVFANPGTRLAVSLEAGQIKTFHLASGRGK